MQHELKLINEHEAVGNYLAERYSYRNFIIARERTLYSVYIDEEHRKQQEPLYRGIFTRDAVKWVDTFYDRVVGMTHAIWNECCPGMTFDDRDFAMYARAAIAALNSLGVFDQFRKD